MPLKEKKSKANPCVSEDSKLDIEKIKMKADAMLTKYKTEKCYKEVEEAYKSLIEQTKGNLYNI